MKKNEIFRSMPLVLSLALATGSVLAAPLKPNRWQVLEKEQQAAKSSSNSIWW